jgi:3-hydroxyacyl-[acyl-carrier-protein] dehydratase
MREHADVRAVLPQRHPLLLVDRVVALDPGRSIRTVKAVTGTEPCYARLGEGTPRWGYAYPSSLIIESFTQSAAVLWLASRVSTPDDGQLLILVGATNFRFESTAYPGDVLTHEVKLDTVIADTAFASGETWVGARRVATVARLVATRRPIHPADPRPVHVGRSRLGGLDPMDVSLWEGGAA